MRLLTFHDATDDRLRLGIVMREGILDVRAAAALLGSARIPTTPTDVFALGQAALPGLTDLAARAAGSPGVFRVEGALRLGPCVPPPGKILCVGLNYRRHAVETGATIPETPVLFSKFGNSLAASGEAVPLPRVADQYDYEVELGLVIGKRARHVAEAEALEYILGYCTANDLSARDLQLRTSQWLLGKTLDKFLPVGPYLVTRDEVPEPQALALRCWVNGEVRQNSTTADMIFSVAKIVSYASRYMTLDPGDLIITGTPEGVVLGHPEPRRWLRPGDDVAVEVEGLGTLVNPLVAEGDVP